MERDKLENWPGSPAGCFAPLRCYCGPCSMAITKEVVACHMSFLYVTPSLLIKVMTSWVWVFDNVKDNFDVAGHPSRLPIDTPRAVADLGGVHWVHVHPPGQDQVQFVELFKSFKTRSSLSKSVQWFKSYSFLLFVQIICQNLVRTHHLKHDLSKFSWGRTPKPPFWIGGINFLHISPCTPWQHIVLHLP